MIAIAYKDMTEVEFERLYSEALQGLDGRIRWDESPLPGEESMWTRHSDKVQVALFEGDWIGPITQEIDNESWQGIDFLRALGLPYPDPSDYGVRQHAFRYKAMKMETTDEAGVFSKLLRSVRSILPGHG